MVYPIPQLLSRHIAPLSTFSHCTFRAVSLNILFIDSPTISPSLIPFPTCNFLFSQAKEIHVPNIYEYLNIHYYEHNYLACSAVVAESLDSSLPQTTYNLFSLSTIYLIPETLYCKL